MDDTRAVELIAESYARTRAAGSARIELSTESTLPMPALPWRRRGGLLRPVVAIAKKAGRRLRASLSLDRSAEGVIDLDKRRYMLDYSAYAQLYADGRQWDGRSGRSLSTLSTDDDKLPTALWLLDLLTGATGATAGDREHVRGLVCQRMTATVDISHAAKCTPGDLAVPAVGRFEDLLALPVDVWVDDEHVRRVRFRAVHGIETLELWDFGVPLDDLDWTRLPAFRSPDDGDRG